MPMPTDTRLRCEIAALQEDVAVRDEIIRSLERRVNELHKELTRRDVDELTGMRNLRWLREWWSELQDPGNVIGAVVFVDVNGLKRVNDTYGHKTGDRVIAHVASALIASGCYGVRYGGDEFLMLIPSGWDVEGTISKVIDCMAASSIPTRDGHVVVTASFGVRILDPSHDLWRMIGDADTAMYEAKRARSGESGYRIVR